jgi:hypothetical protein
LFKGGLSQQFLVVPPHFLRGAGGIIRVPLAEKTFGNCYKLISGGTLIPPGPYKLNFCGGGPLGDHLGHIVLSGLSPGHIDGGKDIFHIDLLGIETSGKKVIMGVVSYFHDTPESGDGGAHGVGATASDKPALLYQARYPKIYARAIHGESSVKPVRPAFRLHPGRPAG